MKSLTKTSRLWRTEIGSEGDIIREAHTHPGILTAPNIHFPLFYGSRVIRVTQEGVIGQLGCTHSPPSLSESIRHSQATGARNASIQGIQG